MYGQRPLYPSKDTLMIFGSIKLVPALKRLPTFLVVNRTMEVRLREASKALWQ